MIGAPRQMFQVELPPEHLAGARDDFYSLRRHFFADAIAGDDRDSHRKGSDGFNTKTTKVFVIFLFFFVGFVPRPWPVAVVSKARSPSPSPCRPTRRAWRDRASPCAASFLHISEPTRLLSTSYAVFCLKKKKSPRD